MRFNGREGAYNLWMLPPILRRPLPSPTLLIYSGAATPAYACSGSVHHVPAGGDLGI